MAPSKVIVFGPTGAVGSAAALTASQLGAEVVLAMRDTSKAIPVLAGKDLQRVTADLTKPDTVREAVASTGAKRAFFYLAFGQTDHMKATAEALKAGGIELAIFLSSFTIRDELAAVPPEKLIPFAHARAEMSLNEVFGPEGCVMLRPGAFASNQLAIRADINKGLAKIFKAEETMDCIAPEDIGAVGGTVLAKGVPADGNRHLYLYGPRLITQRESAGILAKAMGKEVKVEEATEQEATDKFLEHGTPKPFVTYMINQMKGAREGKPNSFGLEVTQADLGNVEKYSGKKAMTFEEWTAKHKDD